MSRQHARHAADRRRRRSSDRHVGFDEFIAEMGNSLFRLAVVLSADVRAGEDLYQETLQRVAVHWAVIDSPAAWSRQTMRNLAVDRYRARSARVAEVPVPDDGTAVPDPRAADGFQAIEVRQALLRALGDLSDMQRLVVALRFLEDRSEAEVAELLSVPLGTVKSTAFRAVARLRRHPSLLPLLTGDEATG